MNRIAERVLNYKPGERVSSFAKNIPNPGVEDIYFLSENREKNAKVKLKKKRNGEKYLSMYKES